MLASSVAWSATFAESAYASGKKTGATYVALGDSFSAGEGLAPYQTGTAVKSGRNKNTCYRSAKNAYPALRATVLPSVSDRAFWACSGATIASIESVPGTKRTPAQHGQPKQTAAVGASTEFITLTAGANDAGLGSVTSACVVYRRAGKTHRFSTNKSCGAQVRASIAKLPAITTQLEGLYNTLLNNSAPDSQLVVAGYPAIFSSSYKGLPKVNGSAFCTLSKVRGAGTAGVSIASAKSIESFVQQLNTAITNAIANINATRPGRIMYSDVYATSVPVTCKGSSAKASVGGISLTASGKGVGSAWKRFVKSGTFRSSKAGQVVYAKTVAATFAAFAVQRKQIAFVNSVGTGAPPATLGPYTMMPFQGALASDVGKTKVRTITTPIGNIGLSADSRVLQVGGTTAGQQWTSWSHGYAGVVFGFGTYANVPAQATLTFPPGTKAVYFYAEPDSWQLSGFTATANNGTSSGKVTTVTLNGNSGATYFGFYAAPGMTITSVNVVADGDFALGEFGISN
jgi:hypothetical protein